MPRYCLNYAYYVHGRVCVCAGGFTEWGSVVRGYVVHRMWVLTMQRTRIEGRRAGVLCTCVFVRRTEDFQIEKGEFELAERDTIL